jgi:hypothetical protein
VLNQLLSYQTTEGTEGSEVQGAWENPQEARISVAHFRAFLSLSASVNQQIQHKDVNFLLIFKTSRHKTYGQPCNRLSISTTLLKGRHIKQLFHLQGRRRQKKARLKKTRGVSGAVPQKGGLPSQRAKPDVIFNSQRKISSKERRRKTLFFENVHIKAEDVPTKRARGSGGSSNKEGSKEGSPRKMLKGVNGVPKSWRRVHTKLNEVPAKPGLWGFLSETKAQRSQSLKKHQTGKA